MAKIAAPTPLGNFLNRLGFGSLPLDALKERYANPKDGSKFIRIEDFDIHYRDEGSRSKPVLFLIHGVSSSLHTWDEWTRILKTHFRVIRFDLPGFGLTGLPSHVDIVPTVEILLDTIEALVDSFELTDPFYMAGNSLGGFAAWTYALKFPQRVVKIVLIDPAGYHMKKMPWMIAAADLPLMPFVARFVFPRALVRRGIREVYGDRRNIQPFVALRYEEISMRPGNPWSTMIIFRDLVRQNKASPARTAEMTRQLTTPTLLQWGSEDAWISPEHVVEWKRDVKGLESIIYRGVGHIPMEEIPDTSAADALDFLLGDAK